MAHIQKRKRKNGQYSYKVIVGFQGAVYNRTFRSYIDAKQWAGKVESGELEEKTEKSEQPTLGETVDRYIKYILPQKSIGTQDKQRQILNWWVKTIGDLQLSSLSPQLLERYKENLSEDKANPTVNIYLDTLSHVFTVASSDAWGYIENNPLLKVKRLPRKDNRVVYLTDKQLSKLLIYCAKSDSEYLFLYVMIAITTGCRRNEIFGLKWKHIGEGTITIEQTKNKIPHSVFLHLEVKNILDNMSDGLKELNGFIDPEQYIFLNEYTGKPVKTIHISWHSALKASGLSNEIKGGMRPHDLRHHFASMLAIKGGATIQEIKHALNHRSIVQTMRYTHLTSEHVNEITRKTMDQMFLDAGID